MNYELAKKLQSAGWTYKDGSRAVGETCTPTLSELIEACGDGFYGLDKDDELGGWACYGKIGPEKDDGDYVVGSTPEEAVASLWLSLNK